jgi:hypothetical protein
LIFVLLIGSTNTGLALQVVREDMLIPVRGDRPNAPDFVLLITDGQSDEPIYTVEQADLLKAQGRYLKMNTFTDVGIKYTSKSVEVAI